MSPSLLAPQSNPLKPVRTGSNQFADKVTPLTAAELCRLARFFLHRRRVGKIARLAPAIREQINVMLRDGLPYAAIIGRLGEAGKTLNKDNLSRWRRADHQDWLAEQNYVEATAGRQPSAPETRDLTLLLTELDQSQATLTCHPDQFPRHLNFLLRVIDSNRARDKLR